MALNKLNSFHHVLSCAILAAAHIMGADGAEEIAAFPTSWPSDDALPNAWIASPGYYLYGQSPYGVLPLSKALSLCHDLPSLWGGVTCDAAGTNCTIRVGRTLQASDSGEVSYQQVGVEAFYAPKLIHIGQSPTQSKTVDPQLADGVVGCDRHAPSWRYGADGKPCQQYTTRGVCQRTAIPDTFSIMQDWNPDSESYSIKVTRTDQPTGWGVDMYIQCTVTYFTTQTTTSDPRPDTTKTTRKSSASAYVLNATVPDLSEIAEATPEAAHNATIFP